MRVGKDNLDQCIPIVYLSSAPFLAAILVRCVYSIRSRGGLVLAQESAETVATFQRDRLRPRPRRR